MLGCKYAQEEEKERVIQSLLHTSSNLPGMPSHMRVLEATNALRFCYHNRVQTLRKIINAITMAIIPVL